MQEQRRQRLEWVRGAKEASTLMAELDLARSVRAKEGAELMRSGDAVTEAGRKAAEAERALEEVRERQAPLREALAGKREQIAAERERAFAERERATAGVTPGLLARYERIRRGKAPLALYALHGDACGHCFTAVPTQRRALIQRGASIEGCEAVACSCTLRNDPRPLGGRGAARSTAHGGPRVRPPHPRGARRPPRAARARRARARQSVPPP